MPINRTHKKNCGIFIHGNTINNENDPSPNARNNTYDLKPDVEQRGRVVYTLCLHIRKMQKQPMPLKKEAK